MSPTPRTALHPRPTSRIATSSTRRRDRGRSRLVPVALGLAILLTLTTGGARTAGAEPPGLSPPTTGGLETIDRALHKIGQHRRLLVIAAHPDDENTTLLTLESLERGGEAAYLSLTRGDGGQNLIGAELGEALGVLRSQELVAARAVDGARQFFTRAYDFGYTRSMQESFERWGKNLLLEDTVRVIRRFKPQVIVAVFPPDARAGHGQHQASGWIAPAAFRIAGDPTAFPEQADEGLAPWTPDAFYLTTWRITDATTLTLEAGGLDALSGRTIHQLSMLSRSQHRSQDMGMIQAIGPRQVPLAWMEGRAGEGGDTLFAGIDTSLSALATLLAGNERDPALTSILGRIAERASSLRDGLSPIDLRSATAGLAELLGDLRAAREQVSRGLETEGRSGATRGARLQVREILDEKIVLAEEALLAAAGIVLDARAARETVVGGRPLGITASVWNAGGAPVTAAAEAWSADGWLAGPVDLDLGAETPAGELSEAEAELTIAPAAPVTLPYYLRRPRQGDTFDWDDAPSATKATPFQAPPLQVRFRIQVAGATVEVDREVTYRYRDQAYGEIRRPLRLVPAIEVSVEPELVVWPRDDREARSVAVTLRFNTDEAVEGEVSLSPSAPWPGLAAVSFATDGAETEQRLRLTLPAPPAGTADGISLRAVAQTDDSRYTSAFPVVDYPHIRPTPLAQPATVQVRATDLVLPTLERIGYIRGASDRVPEHLARIGLPIELLAPADLAAQDLDRYDALVIGSRAYETEPELAEVNPRLLDYARRGGLLLVQYQQYQFVRGGFMPHPLNIERPHGRVTDETAPVRVLVPDHPVFQAPNPIGPADWDGWVQERGLYFAGTWDPAYRPLLAVTDPGRDPEEGGLLVSRLGEGTYVYTGLAFFRQLPAGVPGAYRLFVNLLALAETPGEAMEDAP